MLFFFTKEVSAAGVKDLLGNMIVKSHLQCDFLESEAFLSLVNFLNPRATSVSPTNDAMSAHIMTRYYEAQTKLKNAIHKVKKLSLTWDLWKSPHSNAMSAVTAHWITDDWVLQDVLLDAVEIYGGYSGQDLGRHLYAVIDIYDIRDRVFCLTTNNATGNKKMALYLHDFMPQFLESQHVLGCAGRVFNLAAKVGLSDIDEPTAAYFIEIGEIGPGGPAELAEEEVDEDTNEDTAALPLLQGIRKVISAIRRSPQMRQKLEQTQSAVPQPSTSTAT